MVLIKSISKCGSCTRSSCRNCSNYLGTVQPSEDLDNHKAFIQALGFCFAVIIFIIIF
jgi:hypothetical protein